MISSPSSEMSQDLANSGTNADVEGSESTIPRIMMLVYCDVLFSWDVTEFHPLGSEMADA